MPRAARGEAAEDRKARAHRIVRFITTLFRAPRRAFREAFSLPKPNQPG